MYFSNAHKYSRYRVRDEGRKQEGSQKEEKRRNEMLVFWEDASSGSKTDGSSVGYHLTSITLSFILSRSLDFRLLIFLPDIKISHIKSKSNLFSKDDVTCANANAFLK